MINIQSVKDSIKYTKNIQHMKKIQRMKNTKHQKIIQGFRTIIISNIFRHDTFCGDIYFFNAKNSYLSNLSIVSNDGM